MSRIETPWGVWEAAPLSEAEKLFAGLRVPWWVAGGHAVELAVRQATGAVLDYREHADLDIGVLRRDHLAVRELLADWDCQVAEPPGTLRPWVRGEPLPDGAHDVWVREHPEGPWRIQVMIEDSDGDEWVYRRDPRVRRPLGTLTIADDGPPRLSPEVQLLYKAKCPRPKDEIDLARVLPLLSVLQRRWLARALRTEHGSHPWCALLD
ncbi:amino acid transporter [Spongiactinospora sp. TRM90649]|uniref:amino acid transporter n=1 Tax=Spongiactinospora sp. TRM90649 TaxID=3031114 RepID=UPI0023F83EEF|nr:amino acid transporter [Spongiactinospora sp. TRM90649]MDF5758159.1 amino acid transporter [Spongiactinospora sp. TRM90649]